MSRGELLSELLDMSSPLNNIVIRLNQVSWDSDELINLTQGHIISVLMKFKEGEINKSVVEEWANLIECREDIGRENPHGEVINEVMHELANPYLTEELTPGRSDLLIKKLEC